ncbi:DDE superfamily endonuclease [Methylobacterium sp. yr596]|nr:DDE superfamily endonuclease [Methylobacterium sp. yr596]
MIGRCMQRHRYKESLRFLNTVEAAVTPVKLIHTILDNYGTHKHLKVRAWLAWHPRWIFHFNPTSASWMNAVEGFFSALTRRRLKRGSFSGIVDQPHHRRAQRNAKAIRLNQVSRSHPQCCQL